MIDVSIKTCGDCYMVVCTRDKRIIEQCDCTSARKRRVDVPCPTPPSCWGKPQPDNYWPTDADLGIE